jgi:hypothetical protein
MMERKEIVADIKACQRTQMDRVSEYRETLKHLLEVQVRPSSEFADEWRSAVIESRKVLRNKIEGE